MRATVIIFLFFQGLVSQAQNQLAIPPVLTGTQFNLNVQSGTKIFYDTTPTPTYGINGVWMSPTIMVNQGDSITLNVTNSLSVKTTMHWHGLHVAPMNDGGPHQIINPGATWSPSFKVRNKAATYWYHPHGAGKTEQQISKGLAGLLIVKDSIEAALALPRTYGVDDIPLIVQSKAFDELKQIAIASDMDTALFINGTLNPYFDTPAQVIRFRILNASSLRSFNLGLSNGQTFYQIATDGGLLDTSIALTRLRLSPGERAEILVNFSGMSGQTTYLKSFGSELATGIYGADTVGMGLDTIPDYEGNFLNGSDFNLLQLNIHSAATGAITTIPSSLVSLASYSINTATNQRTIVMDTIRLLPADAPNRAEGPFGMNNKTFNIDSINETVYLNTTEIWTLTNKTLVAHPFHIHDVQFNVIEKNGMPTPPTERGWKDVVLVMPNTDVKFITRFDDFANNMTPYMYHCHLLHHEDDGMMGSFLVIDTNATGVSHLSYASQLEAWMYPNPTSKTLIVQIKDEIGYADLRIFNLSGEVVLSQSIDGTNMAVIDVAKLSDGQYFIQLRSGNKFFTQKMTKL